MYIYMYIMVAGEGQMKWDPLDPPQDPLDPHETQDTRPSWPPWDLRYETLSTPMRPTTRNPESMYKNKVDTTRVQTRDPRATVIFVYANNWIFIFIFLNAFCLNIYMASKIVM